jgi:uncharacterized cupredoxin-like copper-binding protein
MRRTHLLAASALTGAPAAVAGDAPSATASATIKVTGGEYFFRLRSKSAPKGRVTFRFKNNGSIKHDFKIAGKKSRLIKKGKSTSITVSLSKGSYKYVCTVKGHAAAGMRGKFRVR